MSDVVSIVRSLFVIGLLAVAGCSSSTAVPDGRIVHIDAMPVVADAASTAADAKADGHVLTIDASTDAERAAIDARTTDIDGRVATSDAASATSDAASATIDAREFDAPIAPPIDATPVSPVIDATIHPADASRPDATVVNLCGNGAIDDGEQCDDGDSDDFNGCSNQCTLPGALVLVSVSTDGVQLNQYDVGDPGQAVAVSAGGRYVAFDSDATNLVADETVHTTNVFFRDTTTFTTSVVSIGADGSSGADLSYGPVISANGQYVAFVSYAKNLTVNDTSHHPSDVFVRDMIAGTTSQASLDSNGNQGNARSGDVGYIAMSSDGRYIAFPTVATNLVPNDNNNAYDVVLRDMVAGKTSLVSVDSKGVQSNAESDFPAVSADGRYIAFQSIATNLVDDDTNGLPDIFLHDMVSGTTIRVSVDSSGNQGDNGSYTPSISDDGRFVAFQSDADNLVPGDTNTSTDVFVYDTATAITTRVSVDSDGNQIDHGGGSPNLGGGGRFVSFLSQSQDLVPSNTSGVINTFVHDLRTGVTTCMSVNASGVAGNGSTPGIPSVSDDGTAIAFVSNAANLVADDNDHQPDVFRAANIPQQGVLAIADGLDTSDAGGTVDISVILGTQPTADVTIALHVSDGTAGSLSTNSLTFTHDTWNVPQVVVVTGVNNDVVVDNVAYTVDFAAATSSDPIYSGFSTPSIALVNVVEYATGALQVIGLVSDPNGVDNTVIYIWTGTGFQTFYYFDAEDASNWLGEDGPEGWYDSGGNLFAAGGIDGLAAHVNTTTGLASWTVSGATITITSTIPGPAGTSYQYAGGNGIRPTSPTALTLP